jgi:hypothetical protein
MDTYPPPKAAPVVADADDEWHNTLERSLFAAVRVDRALLPSVMNRAPVQSFTSPQSGANCRYTKPPSPIRRRKLRFTRLSIIADGFERHRIAIKRALNPPH